MRTKGKHLKKKKEKRKKKSEYKPMCNLHLGIFVISHRIFPLSFLLILERKLFGEPGEEIFESFFFFFLIFPKIYSTNTP